MFKKHLISLVCFLLILGCLELVYLSLPDTNLTYQRLMSDNSQVKKEQLQENGCLTQQIRQQVSKQILYKKGENRLQTRLISAQSDLIYSKKRGELIEEFKGLNCMMQEELIPMPPREGEGVLTEMNQQMIRQFTAQEAIYSYKSGLLEAKEVEIAHYLLPGYRSPTSLEGDQPLIQGKAQGLQLSLFKEPMMKAQGFQAIFHHWEMDE